MPKADVENVAAERWLECAEIPKLAHGLISADITSSQAHEAIAISPVKKTSVRPKKHAGSRRKKESAAAADEYTPAPPTTGASDAVSDVDESEQGVEDDVRFATEVITLYPVQVIVVPTDGGRVTPHQYIRF